MKRKLTWKDFKETNFVSLNVVDLAIIINNVHRGASDKEVGFEDAYHTLESLTQALGKQMFWIRVPDIESGLWSCNLLDEKGKFWHPGGLNFESFLARCTSREMTFNRKYNAFEGKGIKK